MIKWVEIRDDRELSKYPDGTEIRYVYNSTTLSDARSNAVYGFEESDPSMRYRYLKHCIAGIPELTGAVDELGNVKSSRISCKGWKKIEVLVNIVDNRSEYDKLICNLLLE